MTTEEWVPDILGAGFEACTFPASGPDGVERTATLVRHAPDAGAGTAGGAAPGGGRRSRAVLFLHGWSDYFFNAELAEFWTGQGFTFYALDMHNHGRSLSAGTHGGYVADLDDYDAEITAALGIITAPAPRTEPPPSVALMVIQPAG